MPKPRTPMYGHVDFISEPRFDCFMLSSQLRDCLGSAKVVHGKWVKKWCVLNWFLRTPFHTIVGRLYKYWPFTFWGGETQRGGTQRGNADIETFWNISMSMSHFLYIQTYERYFKASESTFNFKRYLFRIPFREPIFRHFETTPFWGATGGTTGALQKNVAKRKRNSNSNSTTGGKNEETQRGIAAFRGWSGLCKHSATRKRNRGDHNG